MTKKEIYAVHGVQFEKDHIITPDNRIICPLLVNGNEKLGLGVWTFSTLPGTGVFHVTIDGVECDVAGTCNCDCVGCYAKTGRYNQPNTQAALASRTIIAREYTDFMKRAIIAQIKADNIKLCRIHAAGDFFNAEYINAWHDIVKASPNTMFWTYTKNAAAENAFNDLANINIVKSIIPGVGLNFGHCDYILNTYEQLLAAGKTVHICRCGIDKKQHCVNCRGCVENDYVLFIEHSTAYKAAKDPCYNDVINTINAQEGKC